MTPKERQKRNFCSTSCSTKYYQNNPTENVIKGKKIAGKKAGEKRKGKPLSEKHKKAHAKAMAKKRGQKLSLKTRKKLSKSQKKRWDKIPTVERTQRFWRISEHARKLQQMMGWSEDYLEYPVQIERINGPFQKGKTYFLYPDIVHPQLKIAIEVDGKTHLNDKQRRIDKWKTKQLENLGWKVLRFWNEEIDSKPRKVKSKIRRYMTFRLKEHTTSSQIAA